MLDKKQIKRKHRVLVVMREEFAAFDIMKQLCDDGKITKSELDYIAKKRNVPVDKE